MHGNLYATPRAPVEDGARRRAATCSSTSTGREPRQIAEALPDDIVRVFILPPSMAELRARLERRAEDGVDVIERRLANARPRSRHWREYDYVVVNEDLQQVAGDAPARSSAPSATSAFVSPHLTNTCARLLAE